jgi:hypothetical protein
VDPGLIHTGVVSLKLDTDLLELTSTSTLIDGPDAYQVRAWIGMLGDPVVFIEKYRPRSHYGTDERMIKAERDFKKAMPKAVLLNNTGVLQVVTQELLELLELWKFSLSSHHQDLRSAARVAVLGMLRDPEMNEQLTRYVEGLVFDANA